MMTGSENINREPKVSIAQGVITAFKMSTLLDLY